MLQTATIRNEMNKIFKNKTLYNFTKLNLPTSEEAVPSEVNEAVNIKPYRFHCKIPSDTE